MTAATLTTSHSIAPAKHLPDYNRLGLDFHRPMPRPKVRGQVIDFHTHLVAARHARIWYQTAHHYGIDVFVSMTPLEEALGVQRDWPGRIHFIAIPSWSDTNYDSWMNRIEAFYNLGSRIVKFHLAPSSMQNHQLSLESPQIRKIRDEAVARGMIVMTHIGDPDIWYSGRYADSSKFGTREDHYRMWEQSLSEIPPTHPWLGAHLGGNPENLARLQSMLDRFPNLWLDCSATRWMVREISARRDAAREFFIRNQDRIVFGSDQVSNDSRGFDFLASRFWCHRKLWETAYIGPSPILDPDFPPDAQPRMHGLALPDTVLQKLYRDNAIKLMASVGVKLS